MPDDRPDIGYWSGSRDPQSGLACRTGPGSYRLQAILHWAVVHAFTLSVYFDALANSSMSKASRKGKAREEDTASKEDMADSEGKDIEEDIAIQQPSTQAASADPNPPELESFADFCQMQFRLLDGTSVSRYFCPFGVSQDPGDSCALHDITKARTHFIPRPRKPAKNKANPKHDRETFIKWLTDHSE